MTPGCVSGVRQMAGGCQQIFRSKLPGIEEVPMVSKAPEQTLRRAIAVSPLHLIGRFLRDDVRPTVIYVVKRQLRPRYN